MAETLIDYLKTHPAKGFTSRPRYFPEGDYASYYLADTPHHAQRVDDFLTVYLAIDGGALVGCKIKGVRRLLESIGQFGVEIEDEQGIRLGLLFLAASARSEPAARPEYERIGRLVGQASISKADLALAP